MTDFKGLVDQYLALWNEPDPAARSAGIADLFVEDATYTDPLADVGGHAGIGAVISGAREMFPGLRFAPTGDVDGHHDVVRFGWQLVPPAGGEAVAVGFDVAGLADDGRIRAVYGFLDKVPG
ncbi:nuclear transport factor 2 family protein [Plantactinospora endophytica]|uniref:Isomerase n=1 Tax=Plantactinospora endophytica TaxID=673535 RepID=A0ABQ4DWH0_9ACTN|nr:nuclear transport factor 2 family protein [Plantactinospora endophytica]GIG86778.1 isomerase [Plantactinospora endophytica]